MRSQAQAHPKLWHSPGRSAAVALQLPRTSLAAPSQLPSTLLSAHLQIQRLSRGFAAQGCSQTAHPAARLLCLQRAASSRHPVTACLPMSLQTWCCLCSGALKVQKSCSWTGPQADLQSTQAQQQLTIPASLQVLAWGPGPQTHCLR